MSSRPQFHTLQVSAIERLTEDAVALTFGVPDELQDLYAFSPGQHVVLRCTAAGDDGHRTYSLCSSPDVLRSSPGGLRIGVKRIAGGVFSSHALTRLRVGDEVEVMTPTGHFTTTVDPARPRHRAAIAAGSGITPVLSIVSTVLEGEPHGTFTLIYGNRTPDTVMFLDELADLKDRFPNRLSVFHVFSRELRASALLTGRLDRAKLNELLDVAVASVAIDEWFLCGPYDLIETAREALRDRGVQDAAVHFELFHVDAVPSATKPAAVAMNEADDVLENGGGTAAANVTVHLGGRETAISVPRGKDVLHVAMAARPDVPYGCTNGMCGTCRAKVVEGEVYMDHCYALDQAELDAGFVLTCQAQPRSDRLVLDYDA